MAESIVSELRFELSGLKQDARKATDIARELGKDVANSFNGANSASKDLEKAIKDIADALNKKTDRVRSNTQATRNMSSSWSEFKTIIATLGIVSLVQKFTELSATMIKNAESLASLKSQLNSLTGDLQKTSELYDFVKSTSDKLAISTVESGKSFARMANSAKNTIAEGEPLKLMFKSILTASSALRLTQDETNRVFLQFYQIIARQKFLTEDLNRLSDVGIPAIRLLQEQLGKTGEEFQKMVKDGEVGLNEAILLSLSMLDYFRKTSEETVNTVPSIFRRMFNRINVTLSEFYEKLLKTDEIKEIAKEFQNLFDVISDFSKNKAVEDAGNFFGKLASESAVSTLKGVSFWLQVANERSSQLKDWFDKIFGKNENEERASNIDLAFRRFQKNAKEFILGREIFDPKLSTPRGSDLDAEFQKKKAELEKEAKIKLEMEKKAADEAAEYERITLFDIAEKIAEFKDKLDFDNLKEEERRRISFNTRFAANRRKLQNEMDAAERKAERERENAERAIGRFRQKLAREEAQRLKDQIKIFIDFRDEVQESISGLLVDVFLGERDGIRDVLKDIKGDVVGLAKDMAEQFVIAPLFKQAGRTLVGEFQNTGNIADLGGVVGDIFNKLGESFSKEQIEQFKGIGKGVTAGIAGAQVGAVISDLAGANKEQSAAIGALSGAVSGALVGYQFGNFYGAAAGAIVGAAAGAFPALAGGGPKTLHANLLSGSNFIGDTPLSRGVGGQDLRAKTTLTDIALANQGTSFLSDASGMITIIQQFDKQVTNILSESLNKKISLVFEKVKFDESGDGKNFASLQSEIVQKRAFDILSAAITIQGIGIGNEVARNVVGQRGVAPEGSQQVVMQRFEEALSIIRIIEDISLNIDTEAGERIKSINDEWGNLIRNAEVIGIPVDKLKKEMDRLLQEIPNELNESAKLELLQIKDNAEFRREQLRIQHEEERKEFKAAGADLALLTQLQAARTADLEKELKKVPDATKDAEDAINALNNALAQSKSFQSQGSLSIIQQVESLHASFNSIYEQLKNSGASNQELENLLNSFHEQLRNIYRSAQHNFNVEFNNLFDTFNATILEINNRSRELNQLVSEAVLFASDVDRFIRLSRAFANMAESTRLLQGDRSQVSQLGEAIQSFFSFGDEISPVVSEIQNLVNTFAQLRAASIQAGLSVEGFQGKFESSIDILTKKELDRIDALLQPRIERLGLIDEFIASQALGEERPLSSRLSTLENRFFDAINDADIEGAVDLANELRELSKLQFGSTVGFFQLEDRINSALMGLRAEEVAAINDERQIMVDQFNEQVRIVSRLDSSLDLLESLLVQGSANTQHTTLLIELARTQNRLTTSVQSTLETLLRELIT